MSRLAGRGFDSATKMCIAAAEGWINRAKRSEAIDETLPELTGPSEVDAEAIDETLPELTGPSEVDAEEQQPASPKAAKQAKQPASVSPARRKSAKAAADSKVGDKAEAAPAKRKAKEAAGEGEAASDAKSPSPAKRKSAKVADAQEVETDAAECSFSGQSVLGLSMDPFPEDWLQQLWDETEPKSASHQQVKLFEPEREAEMALHYLESIEGSQLLLQLFRVLLKNTLQDLSTQLVPKATETACPHLRMLRDRVMSAAVSAFSWRGWMVLKSMLRLCRAGAALVGESAEFPGEEQLQTILAALEVFESSICHCPGTGCP
ncbi:hypothetical protein AK812_SmicGene44540 [Symbiodinium microadriaticum]|uniref:Uncharacterized protein n=1 Tax=Symbiodinium microadriaticum TaxID=2951 RepID=A0A1Q9BY72_SYMMI|nr:hypothetical protein AK812_SmicGene44540 [Symbiodinium microadriaticum]